MASASPEQQSAARAMKFYKPNKSAKPGKIQRHRATLARRATLTHRLAVWQLRQLRASLRRSAPSKSGVQPPHSKAVSSGFASLRPTALQILFILLSCQKILINAAKRLGGLLSGSASNGGGSASGGSALSRALGAFSGCDPPCAFKLGVRRLDAALKQGVAPQTRSAGSRSAPSKSGVQPPHFQSAIQLAHSKAVSSGFAALRATALQTLALFSDALKQIAFGVRRLDAAFNPAFAGLNYTPNNSQNNRTNNGLVGKVGSSLNGAKKMLLLVGGIAALANYAVPNANGSAIMPSFDQNGGDKSYVNFNLLNNDTSVTYDRGEMKYNDLLIGVAQAVQANNSDYTTNTIEDIMSEWTYQISPDSEVKSGWTASLNNGILDLTHNGGDPGLDYTTWKDTSTNPDSDQMIPSIYFGDQLDFNHNGLIDDNERLTQTSTYVDKAFRGNDINGAGYSSGTNAIGVVPEPTALSLIGLAGAGLIVARRLFR